MSDTRKEKAISALAFGLSVTDTSNKVKVTRKTIYRWLDDDDFVQAVNEKKALVLERVGSRLASKALDSLDVLDELLHSDNESVRLRASKVILDKFTDILEFIQLEKRLEQLEKEVLGK